MLVATGHLGNWELSAFAHAWLTGPMNVVVRPLDNPWIDRLIQRRRELSGNRSISKREIARPILKALAANQAVGILIDQNTTPSEGAFIQFFGQLDQGERIVSHQEDAQHGRERFHGRTLSSTRNYWSVHHRADRGG